MGGVKSFVSDKSRPLCFLVFSAAPDGESQLSEKLGQISEKAGDTQKQDFLFSLAKISFGFLYFLFIVDQVQAVLLCQRPVCLSKHVERNPVATSLKC